MYEKTKTKVIVLRNIKYGESDLILQCLSENGQKVSFFAKAALKSKKRFSGGILEPPHCLGFIYSSKQKQKKESPGQQMNRLEEAFLLKSFEGIRNNYERIEMMYFIIKTVLKISLEGDVGSEALYNIVGHSFQVLENIHPSDINHFKLHFCLKILLQQGVLTPETWMGSFLSISIKNHSELDNSLFHYEKLKWAEGELLNYLESACRLLSPATIERHSN